MRVAAFTKYGSLAASTRQRVLQYVPHLEAAGISVDYRPLLGESYVASLATGSPFSKSEVVGAYLRRMRQLIVAPDFDLLWVYAELFPYLPAAFERLALRSGKPVVYDFDDAFFHQYDEHPGYAARLALRGKLEPLLAGAAVCCCGNEYLRAYAARYCPDSMVLPTVVDTDVYKPAGRRGSAARELTVGWIGSPSTWAYMQPILPLLADLAGERGVRIRVVGAGAKARSVSFPGLDLVEWTAAGEVQEVQKMDIGIMPLPDEPWAQGKSGYKLIQYMACGLPVVASPVGVNSSIIDQGVTGFLASDPAEWKACLLMLLENAELRGQMGSRGREKAEQRYSLKAHAPRLVQTFRSLAPDNRPDHG
jgi:hypothetical protein